MEILSAPVVIPISDPPIINGGVVLDGSEIKEIGQKKDLLSKYPQAKFRFFEQAALLPGLVNAHTHLDLTAFPVDYFSAQKEDAWGMPQCLSGFIDFITGIIHYRKTVFEQTFSEAVEEGIERSIRSGTTCVGDISTFQGEFPIMEKSGLRCVIFPELLSYDVNRAQDLFETATALIEKYSHENSKEDLLKVGLSPHTPYTVSRPLLKIIQEYARESHFKVQIHVAESFQEMEFFFDAKGEIAEKLFPMVGWGKMKPPCVRKTPIQYLNTINFLKCSPTLVHCVQASQGDMNCLVKSKSQVVLCPRSNAFLGVGQAPLKNLREAGIPLGLGTDSLASNTSLSLWDEMRYCYFSFQKSMDDKSPLLAKEVLKMATQGSAKTLGLEDKIGSLEKGKAADLIAVRIQEEVLREDDWENTLFKPLLDRTNDASIRLVMVNGKVLSGSMPTA